MNKVVKTLKLFLYALCVFFFIFYPGRNTFLSLYIREPNAFVQKKQFQFVPLPLARLTNNTEQPYISASSYLVIDALSFTPVLWKNEKTPRLPASTVKMATALTAYTLYPLDADLTVRTTIDQEVLMGLVPGDTISTLNLLYGTLVSSANDAAYTLAENDPDGVRAFVKKMNTLAQTLHMNDTYFTNPIGFDNEGEKTTAHDLALLAQHFSTVPLLMNIASTLNIVPSNQTYTRWYPLTSINQLISTVPGVGGIKTGYTEGAGENLVTYYRAQDTHPFIIVVMGSEDRFLDTRLLITYLDAQLKYYPLQTITAQLQNQ
ncbi:hypothetical protein COU88_03640 [Candidatus Roizmanbacteria bacterium CG10_big_fil_rev_8_21_14_0_10_39_6]|uniref:Peptidase S11 D-alanyl-D-alanine carboxypeptidase A N-terminal domain-containing protein n=1 Tax=Candidatus Roizmanbacteria bacterium CG10_big_fil_rev_8_21_14_0_10_39_6 TaxID=1974853 RepID=A0A2M8KS12_9BACT|nr:MAG: hypothetical protein COU88_03640 [Candidatus Roizmanbacteria bacterium CG10_big_fil_rev_8_21_14_0_10_39_6]